VITRKFSRRYYPHILNSPHTAPAYRILFDDDMRDDLAKIVSPAAPSPTIGERGMHLHQRAIRRRVDFYDTAGRLHGIIALLPLMYGVFQTQRGQPLQPWFWWMVAATVGFAVLARRSPFLRLSQNGISFPDKKSPVYPWDQMCEAHARAESLDLILIDGQRVMISYKQMRASDIDRVKRLVKSQFQYMASAAKATAA